MNRIRGYFQCIYGYLMLGGNWVRVMVHVLMRDAEGRKKEASKVKQTTRQSNTAHPRQSLSCIYMYMYNVHAHCDERCWYLVFHILEVE